MCGGNETCEVSDVKGPHLEGQRACRPNVSERQAGLETGIVSAEPPELWRRPPPRRVDERTRLVAGRRGNGEGMYA